MNTQKTLIIERMVSTDPLGVLGAIEKPLNDGRGVFVFTASAFRANALKDKAASLNSGRDLLNLACTTLNSFVESVPPSLISFQKRTITFEEKLSAIYSILVRSNNAFRGETSFATMVSTAISELKANRVSVKNFKIHANDRKLSTLLKYYEEYEKFLKDNALMDYEDRLEAIIASGLLFDMFGKDGEYQRVAFAGLKKLSHIEAELAAMMIGISGGAIFQTDGAPGPNRVSNVIAERLIARLKKYGFGIEITESTVPTDDFETNIETIEDPRGFSSSLKNDRFQAYVEPCCDRFAEVELLARYIKKHSSKDHSKAGRFGLFVPKLQKYQRIIKVIFEKYDIPFIINEGWPLDDEPAGAIFLAFLSFLRSPSAHGFSELVHNFPIKDFAHIKRSFSPAELYNQILMSHIFDATDDPAKAAADYSAYRKSVSDNNGGPALLHLLDFASDLLKRTALFSRAGFDNISDFLDKLKAFLASSGFFPPAELKNLKVYAFMFSKAEEFCANFSAWNDPGMKFDECLAILSGAIKAIRIPSNFMTYGLTNELENEGRVIIHSRENICLLDLDHILVCGLAEGDFPSSGYDTSFFDGLDRANMKFEKQPPESLDQKFVFHYLLHVPKKGILITTPVSEGNSAIRPSRELESLKGFKTGIFNGGEHEILSVDDVFTSFYMLEKDGPAIEKILAKYEIPLERYHLEINWRDLSEKCSHQRNNSYKGEFSGDISEVSHSLIVEKAFSAKDPGVVNISATRMERFLYCPAAYYFEHILKLKTPEIFEDEIDAMSEGILLHDIIQTFFEDRETAAILTDLAADAADSVKYLAGLEAVLLRVGMKKLEKSQEIKRCGNFYFEMKKFQYFNLLSGFVLPDDFTVAEAGISGYFKNFLRDYIDYFTGCSSHPRVLANEAEIRIPFMKFSAGDSDFDSVLLSKCDRIDCWPDRENNALIFLIVDYKSGMVPAKNQVEADLKIQATFYLNVFGAFLKRLFAPSGTGVKLSKLEEKFKNGVLEKFEWINGRTQFHPAGFIYQSVVKLDARGKLLKTMILNSDMAGKDKLIKTRSHAYSPDELTEKIENVAAIVEKCVKKIAAGKFHLSANSTHDCSQCAFKSICHRNSSAVSAELESAGEAASNWMEEIG